MFALMVKAIKSSNKIALLKFVNYISCFFSVYISKKEKYLSHKRILILPYWPFHLPMHSKMYHFHVKFSSFIKCFISTSWEMCTFTNPLNFKKFLKWYYLCAKHFIFKKRLRISIFFSLSENVLKRILLFPNISVYK